ncbi:MAG: helix-turn-helix transcriptional regulator [Lachnospiraceae bacterium]|nr:helix-turn-helix transcriptional regulator [Lachnospiraceae bacterium]
MNNRIQQLRINKGLSQNEIAHILGITTRAYQNYEYGTNDPQAKTLIQLSDLYNVTIDYLIGRDDKYSINENLPDDEVKMLNAYRKCSQAGKQYLINKAEVIAFEEKAEKQTATAEKEELLA